MDIIDNTFETFLQGACVAPCKHGFCAGWNACAAGRGKPGGGFKITEQEIITEAIVTRLGPHAMLQSDGSIEIGWTGGPDGAAPMTTFFILKFKDGKFDIIEMRTR